MNEKLIGIVLILLIALSMFGGGFYLGNEHAKTKIQSTVIKVQEAQNKEVEKVQQAQIKREIVYRDKIKIVHDAVDDCLDRPVPDDILRSLRPGP